MDKIEMDVEKLIDAITGAILMLAGLCLALTVGAQLVIWLRG
uniref:Uncharacterized protein n=1 Tax=viral metagenome TaxID=1070528 RepID=A0A6M3LLB9_9ZZZZ